MPTLTSGSTAIQDIENVFVERSYQLAKHVTPTLRIDNLLNERYDEVIGYAALSRTVIGGIRLGW